MKIFSSVNVVAAILALIVTGQLFAEEQPELSTEVVKPHNDKVVNALSSPKEKGRDFLVFVSGGFSGYREDVNSTVGEGSTYRIAGGVQHNEWFGLESYAEVAPAIAPKSILNDLRQSFDQRIVYSSIATAGNRYFGVLGKFSFDLKNDFSLFGKIGIAKYEAHQVTANLTLADETENLKLTRLRLERGVSGYSPVVSVGYEIPVPYPDSKKTSGEVSLTQMFDDNVKNLSLNVTLKYTF